jgi:hypothetical protein
MLLSTNPQPDSSLNTLYFHRMSLTQLVVISYFLRSALGGPLLRRYVLRRLFIVHDFLEPAALAADTKSRHASRIDGDLPISFGKII